MATNINNLKSVIMSRISSQITTVQDVSAYEKTGFNGFPAVTVVCSGNENDYWSTAENQRQFTFIIRVYEQLERVPEVDTISDNAKQRAEDIIGRVVSEIIDVFDQYYAFGGAADYCRAVPSSWGYVKIGEGWCRTAEIKINVVQSFIVET